MRGKILNKHSPIPGFTSVGSQQSLAEEQEKGQKSEA